MKLRSLSVNQFKRFSEPTRLGEFGDGLNLVVGPNELGKSTLLDALRAVLFERHRSQALPIRELQNDRSGAAPVVELVFEVDGAKYTLTKRFIKRPYARLQCPDGTLLEGDGAEAELRNLLGFTEAGSRGADSETLGMWGVLWVRQGQSFGRPALPESALASLSAGLESEVGVVLGGRRGRELPQVIEERLGELVTTTRRQPRGEYRSAVDQVRDLERRLSDQQQQKRLLSETLQQLALAEEGLVRLDDGNQDQADQAALTQAQEQLGDAEQRELKVKAARSELENREGQLTQARHAQSERAALRREVDLGQQGLKAADEQLQEVLRHERELSAPSEELRQTAETAEAAVEAAEQSEANWRDTLELITRREELGDLLQRQNEVVAAQRRLKDANGQAARILVTDDSLQRIRQAENAAEQAKTRLSVAATRVSFDIDGDRLAGIEADGAPLTDPPAPVETVHPLTIVIPERGRILVEPAVADREQLVRAERAAHTELQAALRDADAESPTEAQLLRDQRRELEAAASSAQQELERLVPEGGASALEERIGALRERLASASPPSAATDLPERTVADAELRAATAVLQAARAAARVARAAATERSNAITDHRARVSEAQAEFKFRTESLAQHQGKLRRAVEVRSDGQLTHEVELTQCAVAEQQVVADKLEADPLIGSRPQLEARIKRLQKVIEGRAERRIAYQTKIARLRERIEARDGGGIDEIAQHTQNELERATQQRSRLEREIEVLDLLSTRLRSAESEAKERYLAPVLSHIHPYLRLLFPNAEISMDEDLNIVGMSRDVGYEERFDHLSIGTQEQIAVLVRLAFAKMLVDQGAPAAVILDDALAFSDDQRMRLMFDVLSHAAQHLQIVVFTCREQLFEGLGANQLQLAPADPESLRSA